VRVNKRYCEEIIYLTRAHVTRKFQIVILVKMWGYLTRVHAEVQGDI